MRSVRETLCLIGEAVLIRPSSRHYRVGVTAVEGLDPRLQHPLNTCTNTCSCSCASARAQRAFQRLSGGLGSDGRPITPRADEPSHRADFASPGHHVHRRRSGLRGSPAFQRGSQSPDGVGCGSIDISLPRAGHDSHVFQRQDTADFHPPAFWNPHHGSREETRVHDPRRVRASPD